LSKYFKKLEVDQNNIILLNPSRATGATAKKIIREDVREWINTKYSKQISWTVELGYLLQLAYGAGGNSSSLNNEFIPKLLNAAYNSNVSDSFINSLLNAQKALVNIESPTQKALAYHKAIDPLFDALWEEYKAKDLLIK